MKDDEKTIDEMLNPATAEDEFLTEEYYCQALPKAVQPVANKIVRKFYNWAQANSLWILAFGTGCGSIELPPLFTAPNAEPQICAGAGQLHGERWHVLRQLQYH